jgi:hypothetical protein
VLLEGHVDEGGDPATSGRAASALVVVGGRAATDGIGEMGMHVDGAGDDDPAMRPDLAPCGVRQAGRHGGDGAVFDPDVFDGGGVCGDYAAAADDEIKLHIAPYRAGPALWIIRNRLADASLRPRRAGRGLV